MTSSSNFEANGNHANSMGFVCKLIYIIAICAHLGKHTGITAYRGQKLTSGSRVEVGKRLSSSISLKPDEEIEGDDKSKFKVVDANDISSLFNSIPVKSEEDEDEDEDEDEEYDDIIYYDDDEDDEEFEDIDIIMDEEGGGEEEDKLSDIAEPNTAIVSIEVSYQNPTHLPQLVVQEEEVEVAKKVEVKSSIMEELRAMEKAALEGSPVAVFAVNNVVSSIEEDIVDKTREEIDIEGYFNLKGELDQITLKRVRDSMTVKEAPDKVVPASSSRVFGYDPVDNTRVDPMKYGAYRRWKAPEMEVTAKSKRRRKGGSKKGKKTNKKDGGFTTDSFYEAIKGLGRGDRKGPSQGSDMGGTTFQEPKDKPPIQPNKPIPKKNKRKTITPEDIDSLFPSRDAGLQSQNVREQIKKEEESNEDENNTGSGINTAPSSSAGNTATSRPGSISMSAAALTPPSKKEFNPMDKDVPQWLQEATDAEKQRKKDLKKGRGKKKQLTDDWRFWAAIIGGAGFVSAFINIYGQTGGFGGGTGPGGGLGGGGGGNELVI